MIQLVQISDCHLLGDTGKIAYQGINPFISLEAVLKDIASLKPDGIDGIDGIIVTGDISGDDSAASYQHFLQLMTQYVPDIPWRVIAGNHDNNEHFGELLRPYNLNASSPWQLGEWLIVGLDTRHQGTRGHVSPAQLESLANAASHNRPVLLALHHHIRPTGSWMDKHDLINAPDVITSLNSLSACKLAVHGHIHSAVAYSLEHCEVLSAPSTCWQWEMQADFAVADESPGYRVLTLNDDATWQTSIRRTK